MSAFPSTAIGGDGYNGPDTPVSRRKHILRNLLAALQELSGEDANIQSAGGPAPAFEDDRDIPTVDEHLQIVGAEAFRRFSRALTHIDKELRNFSNSARQLASSVGLISSASQLRRRLTDIGHLFHENAADLFPRKIAHEPRLSYPEVPEITTLKGTALVEYLEPDEFPEQLDLLGKDVLTFVNCFNELLGYSDEAYWASGLKAYEGQFRYPGVQRYLHDLSVEMSEPMEQVGRYLTTFTLYGVPAIRDIQQHGENNELNLTTLATFLSAVTATTLQFSYQSTGNLLANTVNGFWFTSLVLSSAAAVNSLLRLTWKRAMYIGSTAVLTWVAMERYAFLRYNGTKWLSDILRDVWYKVLGFGPIQRATRLWNISKAKAGGATWETLKSFHRMMMWVRNRLRTTPHSPPSSCLSEDMNEYPDEGQASDVGVLNNGVGSTTGAFSESESATSVPGVGPIQSHSPGRTRWRNAVRSVIRTQAAARGGRHTVTSSSLNTPYRKDALYPPVSRASRVTALVTKLRNMGPTEDIAAHTALVRHLQFSPDGMFLATSSWDRTSVIFQTGAPFMHHRTLAHPSGFVGQVAWSPGGNLLLTKLNRSIKVWTKTGVCTRTIERGTTVQSITWMPGGEAFLSVEGSSIALVDLTGKQVDVFHFDRLKIHDVSVTPDGARMLGVGTMLTTKEGIYPNDSTEKQIIIYNIERKEIECYVPIFHEIRDITVTKSGQYALVSYELNAPPQLWRLEVIRQRIDVTEAEFDAAELLPVYTSHLSLRHTYMPKFKVDFAGPTGDIHIWDRESGALLHHIRAQNFGGGDLTCIAWNPAADPYIFATGSHDGAVRIWTTLLPGTTAPPSIDELPGQNSHPNALIQRNHGPRPTPRSITPLSDTGSAGQYLDAEQYRTESPTQQDFDVLAHGIDTCIINQSRSSSQFHLQTGVQINSQDTLPTSQPTVPPSGPLSRTVAYQTSQALGNVVPAQPASPLPEPSIDGPPRSLTRL
ncbi:WD40 repeat-like protein [Peniophora sp. CONT]|nr:WD40 repeat-like protein [Peniophora sp. CONT]